MFQVFLFPCLSRRPSRCASSAHQHSARPHTPHVPSPPPVCFCAPRTSSCARRTCHARPDVQRPPKLHAAPHTPTCPSACLLLRMPPRTAPCTSRCAVLNRPHACPAHMASRDACPRCSARPPRTPHTHTHAHPILPHTQRPAASACHTSHTCHTRHARVRLPPRTLHTTHALHCHAHSVLTRTPAAPAAVHGHARRTLPYTPQMPLTRYRTMHALPCHGRSFMLRAPTRHAARTCRHTWPRTPHPHHARRRRY